MGWQRRERWRNEYRFVGPHRFLAQVQKEMNELGKEDPPWQLHGWDEVNSGDGKQWLACMSRSVDENDKEEI